MSVFIIYFFHFDIWIGLHLGLTLQNYHATSQKHLISYYHTGNLMGWDLLRVLCWNSRFVPAQKGIFHVWTQNFNNPEGRDFVLSAGFLHCVPHNIQQWKTPWLRDFYILGLLENFNLLSTILLTVSRQQILISCHFDKWYVPGLLYIVRWRGLPSGHSVQNLILAICKICNQFVCHPTIIPKRWKPAKQVGAIYRIRMTTHNLLRKWWNTQLIFSWICSDNIAKGKAAILYLLIIQYFLCVHTWVVF